MKQENITSPLVSVIIPAHNAEQYIVETLDSVVNQTYSNLQIIVVDDASTDNTLKLLSEYQDSRLEVIPLAQNLHAAYARNFALSHVKGKYIAYLDADDFWYPTKIEKQVQVLENNNQYCSCFTWAHLVDENSEYVEPCDDGLRFLHNAFHEKNRNQKELLLFLLTNGNYLNSCSSLIRTEVIEEIGGQNLSLIQLHDFEHWIRLASYGEIYMLCEELTVYRRIKDGSSLSATNRATKVRTENEEAFVYKHFFDHISDDRFIELFHDMFIHSDSRTPDELKCEKAFLLKSAHCGPEAFLANIQELLSNESTATLLINHFHYTPVDFYNDNKPIRYFSFVANEENEYLKNYIKTMEGSWRWRFSSIIANIVNKLLGRNK